MKYISIEKCACVCVYIDIGTCFCKSISIYICTMSFIYWGGGGRGGKEGRMVQGIKANKVNPELILIGMVRTIAKGNICTGINQAVTGP